MQKIKISEMCVMSANNQSKRLDFFDVVKGLTILSVVYVHSGAGIGPLKFFVSYYMPLFFVISGYFFKQRSLVTTVKRCASQLLIPFYVSGFCGILFALLLPSPIAIDATKYIKGLLFGQVYPYIGIPIHCLWFFYALFWSRILFAILDRFFGVQVGFAFAVVLFLLSIRLPSDFNLQSWFYYLHGFSGVIFLYVGRICRLTSIFERNFSCIILAVFLLSCVFSLPKIYMDHLVFEDSVKDMVVASLMSISTILLIKKFCKVPIFIISKSLSAFKRIGYHSLLIYSVESVVFISGYKGMISTYLCTLMPEKSILWRMLMGLSRIVVVLTIAFFIIKLKKNIEKSVTKR